MRRLIAHLGVAGAVTAGAGVLGSPALADAVICVGYTACDIHGYDKDVSHWGAEPGTNCTNYASYMLIRNGVPQPGSPMGDAYEWNKWRTPDDRPAVGSIAWWDRTVGYGDHGHVAYVERVEGDTITISEDNYQGTFRWRTIDRGSPVWPSGFLHFKDLAKTPAPWGGVGTAVFLRTDRLTTGMTLRRGQYITSGNRMYALVFQRDGNLVMYHGKGGRWSSRTAGKGGDRVVMQADGNLVMYRGRTPVWATNTQDKGPSYVAMQNDGNLVVYRNSGGPTWASNTARPDRYRAFPGGARLRAGQVLRANQYLASTDKRYALLLRSDGDLVLYGPGYHVLWTSRTAGSRADRLVMQRDGNLVAYRKGRPVWATRTGHKGASHAVLQNDGNLVVYRNSGGATWATRTTGKI
ncbi:MAG TPA: CHAP domain-containing protein [Thermomonospora sp.]|nr:CHAP domain-containing protein [Thermomonospora sp.]